MAKETPIHEIRTRQTKAVVFLSSFELWYSFGIRHSGFVISWSLPSSAATRSIMRANVGSGTDGSRLLTDSIGKWPPLVPRVAGRRPRSLTLRSRIPGIAQTVAEKIQRQQRRGQGDTGINNHPPINADRIDLRRTFGDE